METKPDTLETARVSFYPPGVAAPHDLGEVEIETSLGLGHGAFEISSWSIPDEAFRDLQACEGQSLVWRIEKASGATFEGAFSIENLSPWCATDESPFSVSLVARSPIGQKVEKDPEPETVTRVEPGRRPMPDQMLGAEVGREAMIEALAGKAHTAVGTVLASLIKTRVPELPFNDAFAAVLTGGLDAVVRVLAAAMPDEDLAADTIKAAMTDVLDQVIQGVVSERLLARVEAPE